MVYQGWWSPQQSENQTSSSLINFICVKGPVRTATLGEHIGYDVCQATGSTLLTRAHTEAVTHIQAEYQSIASNFSKGG